MSKSFWMLAAVALSLTLTLSGCGKSPTDRVFDDAGNLQGKVDALPQIAPQPEQCRQPWVLLTRAQMVGHDKLTVIKLYENYITRKINPTKAACWQYNEDIRLGLAATVQK